MMGPFTNYALQPCSVLCFYGHLHATHVVHICISFPPPVLRVLALNYVGTAGGCIGYIAGLVREVLPHVRVFQDTNDDAALKNYVFFASLRPLTAAAPVMEDVGTDGARAQYFSLLTSYEVTDALPGWAGPRSHASCFGQAGMWSLAEAHWLAMAESFPPGFWARVTY